LERRGFELKVRKTTGSTRTAQEAAEEVGCALGQIVKSLVFRCRESGRPVMVVASGSNRVNEKKLSLLVGEKILKADADFVREKTGYAIGGIPPIGHATEMAIFIDEDLFRYDLVWAAAGSPFAVFGLTPEQLKILTGGRVIPVR
jgi:prolyl-tRNA editing enzyme YbaK/EbsC (Cys-tRNA(Pro) deacylase)